MAYLPPIMNHRDVHYDHEPATILQFRARDAVAQARYSAQALESDRAATTPEGEVVRLQVATANAWEKFQLATKAMVAAQNAMNDAHSKWLGLDLQLFAANAALRAPQENSRG